MTERILSGLPASPGIAMGGARVLDSPAAGEAGSVPEPDRSAEVGRALGALEKAAGQIRELAAGLVARGNEAEAEIVETGALMAADPGLVDAVRNFVLAGGVPAGAALVLACEHYAQALEAIDDPVLALRADDVRSVGRRAARIVAGATGDDTRGASGDVVLVARDLGPADVAELGSGVRAVALSAGGVMAHAAIVARSLGIPMVVALGEGLLEVDPGGPLVVDGGDGSVAVAPGRGRRQSAQLAAARRLRARERAAEARALPAETLDGHAVRVLSNVASSAEVGVGLAAGADGVGLFRTELRFLDARAWPTEKEHRVHIAPVLACLEGMTATVRLLDFGGDKTPPFLRGTDERGIGLLLSHPGALRAQLEAIVAAGAHSELRILLPMVEHPADVDVVRELLAGIEGGAAASVGAMIETAAAVGRAAEIAAAADFLSIGTNDLTHSVLGSDRFAPGDAHSYHPEVLRAIAAIVAAATAQGRIVEVCGEAASDPVAMPLLIGLRVDELSVGAARVGPVRSWVRALRFGDVRVLTERALELGDAPEVENELKGVAALLAELDDAVGESLDGSLGVAPLGAQA